MPEIIVFIIGAILMIIGVVCAIGAFEEESFKFVLAAIGFFLPAAMLFIWSYQANSRLENMGGYPVKAEQIYDLYTEQMPNGTSYQFIKVYTKTNAGYLVEQENMTKELVARIPEGCKIKRITLDRWKKV